MLLAALVDTNRWVIRNDNMALSVGTIFEDRIVVEDIHAVGQFMTELPANWTAVVTLSGPGVENLTRDTILKRHYEQRLVEKEGIQCGVDACGQDGGDDSASVSKVGD